MGCIIKVILNGQSTAGLLHKNWCVTYLAFYRLVVIRGINVIRFVAVTRLPPKNTINGLPLQSILAEGVT